MFLLDKVCFKNPEKIYVTILCLVIRKYDEFENGFIGKLSYFSGCWEPSEFNKKYLGNFYFATGWF